METWLDTHLANRNIGNIIADVITAFVGSWWFVGIHAFWFAAWIVYRAEPFPYGLLTLIVSLEAIFLSTFVMMNQNRQTDRDRANAEADFKTNREAKTEIENLQLDKLIEMVDKLTSSKEEVVN